MVARVCTRAPDLAQSINPRLNHSTSFIHALAVQQQSHLLCGRQATLLQTANSQVDAHTTMCLHRSVCGTRQRCPPSIHHLPLTTCTPDVILSWNDGGTTMSNDRNNCFSLCLGGTAHQKWCLYYVLGFLKCLC